MIRFVILAIVGYILYRAVRNWMFSGSNSAEHVTAQDNDQIDDDMVKDPYCEVYFPKRNAVHLHFNDQDLYFCSAECKKKYLDEQSPAGDNS
jgi:YHS domain-containing protein